MSEDAMRLTLIACSAAAAPDRLPATDDPPDDKVLRRLGARARSTSISAQTLCSPARAAQDTARTLGITSPRLDDDLRDRDHGRWSGRSLTELAGGEPAGLARWLGDPEFAPPGGESVADTLRRAATCLDRLHGQGSVIALTHAALVRSFVVSALGCAPGAWFRLDIGHGTRTVLTRHGSIWRVALVGARL